MDKVMSPEKESDMVMALEVIEALVSDGLCEDIAMFLADGLELSKEDIRLMGSKILTIYRISHSVNPHSCYSVHEGWRQEMRKLKQEMVK